MKIVADENIVGVAGYFGALGELLTLPGREISAAAVRDADALLVRSVTRVDAALLENSAVRYVGTATSGLDHVDLDYLRARGIAFHDAAGANADSVVEYVFCALAALQEKRGIPWRERRVGIVGAGHIGGRLARRLQALGVEHVIHDPFLEPRAFPGRMRPLREVLAQDILSLHVPLTRTGAHPTFHMIDAGFIDACAADQVLINAARGGVVDNAALLRRLRDGRGPRTVLDAWENEPAIDLELLARVDLGSAHIAGYSFDGKLRGTEMIWRGLRDAFGLRSEAPEGQDAIASTIDAGDFSGCGDDELINRCLLAAYDIREDHGRLLALGQDPEPARGFDLLRKHYPVRREFRHFSIRGVRGEALARQLRALGFSLG